MKKNILPLLAGLISFSCPMAQKCLDISIVSIMEKMETPGDAATSFKKCNINKNDHNQTVIVNYGTDLVQLDTIETQTLRNFNMAYVSSMSPTAMQVPSQQQINDTKALAEKLKSMTPEQQQQWAKQMYLQNNNAGARPVQDDAPTMQQVMHVRDIAVSQMKALNDEFSGKLNEIDDKCSNEIKIVAVGDKSKCPSDKVGMPSCDCVNKIEGTRWKQVVEIQNKYDAQKIAVYQTYFSKIKAMASEVESVVIKYKYGNDIKSTQMKGFLFTSQSSAFANAVLVTTICIEKIRKDGSTAYLNKTNSDNGVYDISCSHL